MWLGVNEADEEEVPYYENALHYKEENKTFYDTAMKDRRPTTEGRHSPILERDPNVWKDKVQPFKA